MFERVFRPLGMTRTSMTWERWFEDDFSNGYDEAGKSLGRQRRDRADAAGSMETTVADYAKFLQAVMNGTGLHPESREMMLSPQVRIKTLHQFPTLSAETTNQNDAIRLSYGLAWGLYWTPYGKVFFKEGHDYGWQNYVVVFDQKKMGMLIMTNSDNGESMYDDLLRTIQGNTFTPVEWEQFGKSN
jgi:CubicO group peptidase (beta-lactamase class C family)